MSNQKYKQAIIAADQLTIKALQAEFDAYRAAKEEEIKQIKCDYEFAIKCSDLVIESLKNENEQLQRFIFASGAKL